MRLPPLPHLRIEHVRFLLIVFVVLIHARPLRVVAHAAPAGSTASLVRAVIDPGMTAIAVPMFALISGYLFFYNLPFRADLYWSKIRRRLGTLVAPYLLCSAGNLVVLALLQQVPATRTFFSNNPEFFVTNLGIGDFAHRLIIRPIPVQLWFVRDLIVLVAMSPIIGGVLMKFRWWPLLPLFGAWTYSRMAPGDTRVFLSTVVSAFFVLGGWLAMYRPEAVHEAPRWKRWLIPLWLASAVIVTWGLSPGLLLRGLARIQIFIGITALWWNVDLLRSALESRWLAWLPPTSFFVFLMHQPLLRVLERIASRLPIVAQRSELFAFLALPAFTIVLCSGVAVIMERLTPRAYRLITGNRVPSRLTVSIAPTVAATELQVDTGFVTTGTNCSAIR